ncbi:hypothetical protein CALVIDRAFT_531905 [Calocera viscosa TUFC12733]|uniref:Uncharacterized protein n=1 Tax=Calocera viscosa (strain TUFC12733) TaxID=1330018 RepID=A0A167FPM3_CALVF|nr:hypothetical protein CALVIDRAFT_531905 [Calocera viscosa TUFC12733]
MTATAKPMTCRSCLAARWARLGSSPSCPDKRHPRNTLVEQRLALVQPQRPGKGTLQCLLRRPPDGLNMITLNMGLQCAVNYFNCINMTVSECLACFALWPTNCRPPRTRASTDHQSLLAPRCRHHFFGHMHEGQFHILYANNANNIKAAGTGAGAIAWIVPSIIPLTNVGLGLAGSFRAVDNQTAWGPNFIYQYSMREMSA